MNFPYRGTLSFIVNHDYLGVAFVGLRERGPLYPAVSCVYGGALVTLNYCGSSP